MYRRRDVVRPSKLHTKRFWSQGEVKRLRRLWTQKATIPEIAIKLHRTYWSVLSKLESEKLWRVNKPHWTPKQIATLKKLYLKTPTKKLTKLFGKTIYAISMRANHLGLWKRKRPSSHNRRWTPKEKQRVKTLRLAGLGIREMQACVHRRTSLAIRQALDKMGVT